MKTRILFCAMAMVAAPVWASESDDLKAAAKKLAGAENYGWHTTVTVPEGGGGRFRPGPTDGKTQKDGLTWLSMTRGDNLIVAALKGGKGAAKMEGEWRTLDDLESGDPGPATFLARTLRAYKTPAAEAEDLAGKIKELKKEGEVYSGDLTEDGAKALLAFRGGRPGGQSPPAPSGAKGSVKFWVKDGQLSKYELKVQGKLTFNGEDREIDRTTTVEIKDVGAAKIELPEDAQKKLS